LFLEKEIENYLGITDAVVRDSIQR